MSTSGSSSFQRLWPVPLVGLGQILFQQSALSGLLFLVGIACGSALLAFGATCGAVIGTVVAKVLRYPAEELEAGLFGFNPALVGIACYFYLPPATLTHVLVVSGCVAATVATRLMRQFFRFPTYTAPFIVVTWIVLAIGRGMGLPAIEHPAGPDRWSAVSAILEGIGEVMFQAKVTAGILFLVGIAVNSLRCAAWALAGSSVGLAIAVWGHDPSAQISIGIFGYNAALAAMALTMQRRLLIYPILGAALSIPIAERFPATGLETLTTPFVLATWIVLAWDRFERKFAGDMHD